MKVRRNQKGQRGGVLVMFAVAMIVIIGSSGLAVDIGRMYVNRTEAQAYVDARALAEAVTRAGALNNIVPDQAWKLHDFSNMNFQNVSVQDLGNAVRVEATVQVPLVLLPVILGQNAGTVSAVAVATVERITSMAAGGFPYAVRNSPTGFVPFRAYTFRWGNNVAKDVQDAWGYVVRWGGDRSHDDRLALTARILAGQGSAVQSELGASANPPNINVWCEGDANVEFLRMIDAQDPIADGLSNDFFAWNGAFFQGGTNLITAALAHGYQTEVIAVDGSISVATGVRQATVNELRAVVNSDADSTSYLPDYALVTDDPAGMGTGERIMYAPVVSGADTMFLQPGAGARATIVAIEAFLLMPANTYGNPQSNWCAQYAGARFGATGDSLNQSSGVWTARLIQ